jgi:hypothetical protein
MSTAIASAHKKSDFLLRQLNFRLNGNIFLPPPPFQNKFLLLLSAFSLSVCACAFLFYILFLLAQKKAKGSRKIVLPDFGEPEPEPKTADFDVKCARGGLFLQSGGGGGSRR